jgi:hypothetical protein
MIGEMVTDGNWILPISFVILLLVFMSYFIDQ